MLGKNQALKIVIGLPAYNEEKNIATILIKLKKISESIIVCNDGSNDMTAEIAEKLGAIIINHPKNLGYGASIRSIFQKAKELEADVLVTFDADGQHRVEDIQTVIEPILKKESDIVIGSRFLDNHSDSMPTYRKIGIKALSKLVNASIEDKITDSQSGFRAYSKQVLTQLMPTDSGMGISNEILIKANRMNFRIKEVPITILYSGETSTHHPVSHGLSVILSTMKFISIEHPLKFYAIPGIICSTIGLFFVGWTVQYFTEYRSFPPVLALIAIGFTVIGAILVMTAIMLFSLVTVVRERN